MFFVKLSSCQIIYIFKVRMQICRLSLWYNKHMLHISVGNVGFLLLLSLMLQQTVVNMRNRTQYLTALQFDLWGVQDDKLDHYRKGAVPEQPMFPISYVKGCKKIHQYTPRTGELVLVNNKYWRLLFLFYISALRTKCCTLMTIPLSQAIIL